MLKFPTIASDGSQRPDEPRRLSQVTFSNTARSNSIVLTYTSLSITRSVYYNSLID